MKVWLAEIAGQRWLAMSRPEGAALVSPKYPFLLKRERYDLVNCFPNWH